MFGKLFGKKTGNQKPEPTPKSAGAQDQAEVQAQAQARVQAATQGEPGSVPEDPVAESLYRAVDARRAEDPMIGAKIGAKEILQQTINALKTERGVRIEDLLAILATLAGYACHMSVREQPSGTLTEATTSDGGRFFFGDALNRPLAESQYSVWSICAGTAQQLGVREEDFPDLGEIFNHVSASVGWPHYGIPRLPEAHMPGEPLANYLKIWKLFLPRVRRFCPDAQQWPMLYAIAIAEAMEMAKGVIAPQLALRLVMECAIPMSKVDPASVEEGKPG